MSSLAGRTVVVTRAAHQVSALARLLSRRGAAVVAVPTITIAPPADWERADAVLRDVAQYDWLVCTSANAVQAIWSRLALLGVRIPEGLGVAAVGPATAAALADRGVRGVVLPEVFRGDAMAGAIPEIAGTRVLLPRGDLARDATVEAMAAAGAHVDTVTVYQTIPAPIEPEALATLREGVDAITFTAPSTVRSFTAALGTDARDLLRATVVACIGPVTASAIRALGLPEPLVATEATAVALVEALEAHFR